MGLGKEFYDHGSWIDGAALRKKGPWYGTQMNGAEPRKEIHGLYPGLVEQIHGMDPKLMEQIHGLDPKLVTLAANEEPEFSWRGLSGVSVTILIPPNPA